MFFGINALENENHWLPYVVHHSNSFHQKLMQIHHSADKYVFHLVSKFHPLSFTGSKVIGAEKSVNTFRFGCMPEMQKKSQHWHYIPQFRDKICQFCCSCRGFFVNFPLQNIHVELGNDFGPSWPSFHVRNNKLRQASAFFRRSKLLTLQQKNHWTILLIGTTLSL